MGCPGRHGPDARNATLGPGRLECGRQRSSARREDLRCGPQSPRRGRPVPRRGASPDPCHVHLPGRVVAPSPAAADENLHVLRAHIAAWPPDTKKRGPGIPCRSHASKRYEEAGYLAESTSAEALLGVVANWLASSRTTALSSWRRTSGS